MRPLLVRLAMLCLDGSAKPAGVSAAPAGNSTGGQQHRRGLRSGLQPPNIKDEIISFHKFLDSKHNSNYLILDNEIGLLNIFLQQSSPSPPPRHDVPRTQ